ncbi:MAG: 1,4-alpha-glucan branching protein GlgB [Chloroflexota bacterium]|nr:MAG: 1,4-alpha-glucan branching protein GlgB [Chloroflexota bacterium]
MNANPSTVPAETVEAIVGGYHGDPFSILGQHATDTGVAVRAFVPQAVEAAVVERLSTESHPMTRAHDGGYFELFLPGRSQAFDYSLQLEMADGQKVLYEDPYAFSQTISEYDEYLLAEGTHRRLYDALGAHLHEVSGVRGVRFAVWAPNALRVSVVGDFNNWDGRRHVMRHHHGSGVWDIFVPGLLLGVLYKYEIKTRHLDYTVVKSDPVGFYSEVRPDTASIVWDLDNYDWQDQDWLEERAKDGHSGPMNVYEVHLGSWRRTLQDQWLSYRELAEQLVPYVKEMGYTHVELLPVAEHPYDGSWGYQVTGFFAATSRYGTPDDFMAFIDACHLAGLGVILDWVPAHFPRDQHGLAFFDGTFLYEHADPRQGEHPDWGTLIFNFGRREVRQFLVNNAMFWLDKYHVDALRVDAVASMLYLDFSRQEGQWIPNRYGGRENIEAIDFIREFNDRVHAEFPGVLTIAEESTAWAGVTRSTADGGLGFDLKWNMGWMHDTLQYIENDPIHRSYHHGTLTFSLLYAFSERFLLPFSHDEVVHLKRSMLDKMPGDLWQKFANLRALYAYQAAHPGKKMLFMGGEFGQWREWNEAVSLDWHLLDDNPQHRALQAFVKTLNWLYLSEPALYELDSTWEGFDWLDLHDGQRSILTFVRHDASGSSSLIVAINFTPIPRQQYRLGVPLPGDYEEVLNSDAAEYGGSGVVNPELIRSQDRPWHDQPHSIEFDLPPLAAVILRAPAPQ